MRVDRHFSGPLGLVIVLLLTITTPGCRVYTVNKVDLETELKPSRGLSVAHIYKRAFRNSIDSLWCVDKLGGRRLKRINQDSRITIVTKGNRAIRFYAKTLYLYKNEFLIGERTAPSLRGPNYYPVRLSEIDRIEVTGFSF